MFVLTPSYKVITIECFQTIEIFFVLFFPLVDIFPVKQISVLHSNAHLYVLES